MRSYREARAYIIGEDKIVEFDKGTGDNLLPEDYEAGYVDYIYYTIYDISELDEVIEEDGGMILLERDFFEEFAGEDGEVDYNKVADRVMEFTGYGDYILL